VLEEEKGSVNPVIMDFGKEHFAVAVTFCKREE